MWLQYEKIGEWLEFKFFKFSKKKLSEGNISERLVIMSFE